MTINSELAQPDTTEKQQRLINPRLISQETDPDGRQKLLEQAKQIKSEKKVNDFSVQQKQTELMISSQQRENLFQKESKQKLELKRRADTLIFKLKQIFGIDDKKTTDLEELLNSTMAENKETYGEISNLEKEIGSLQERQSSLPKASELLAAYYEKMANTPLTNEEKRELLKPELLSTLTMEQYIALWRRLNPYFLAHVTRQGFRDHNAMIYHSGEMNEFRAGFVEMAQDQKILRSPMAVRELRNRNDQSIMEWLGDWVLGQDEEETALSRLDSLINANMAAAPKYPDSTAVHFATQLVADSYYGGEKNNEVFIIYPSDVIASQHNFAFNGWEKDFTKPQSETKWNDVFVWPNEVENAGIPIDSGIVFLPKDTLVDPQTGSKYASDMITVEGQEKISMVEDEELINKFIVFLREIKKNDLIWESLNTYLNFISGYEKDRLRKNLIQSIAMELNKLGFNLDIVNELAEEIIGQAYYSILGKKNLNSELNPTPEFDEVKANEIIREVGAHFKRTENGVRAEEYWESFFQQHPDLKPNHIVYYDGDPTLAVHQFIEKNGIGRADTSDIDGELLGFDDKHVEDMENDPRANLGKAELEERAKQIIKEHFQN